MTKRDILSIALKITGIVFLVLALVDLPTAIFSVKSYLNGDFGTLENTRWLVNTTIAVPIFAIVVAYLLIAWADEISKRLIRADSDVSVPQLQGSEPIMFTLALRFLGVVTLVRAIPLLLQTITSVMLGAYRINHNQTSNLFDVAVGKAWANEWGVVVGQIVAIVIGVILVFGAKQIASCLVKRPLDTQK